MSIHLTKLLALSTVRSLRWHNKPFSLGCYVAKRHLQEFPDLKHNNVRPTDYVLILPEPLNEQPSSNEILRLPKEGEPETDFSKLNAEKAFKGLSQTVCAFENFVTDVNNANFCPDKPIKEFFLEIERHLFGMDTAYNILMALLNVDSEKYNYNEIHQLLNRYYHVRDTRFLGNFKETFKNYIMRDYSKISEAEKKLLKIYYGLNPFRRDITKMDEATYNNYRSHLSAYTIEFQSNLAKANELFSHTVDDPDILAKVSAEFEDCQNLHHKERTPLKITPMTYQKFMQLCPDRFIRQLLWQTYNKRCSPKGLPRLNNLNLISNIRVCRRKLADVAGYRSHVDCRLDNAMAQSRQQLLDNFETLNAANTDKMNDRLQELNDYAYDNNFQDSNQLGIQEYDFDYWSNRYMYEILIGKSKADLKSYFPLDVVLRGLYSYFNDYFGITIKTSTKDNKKLWAPGLYVLEVERNNQPLGKIIHDPYHRDGKRILEPFYARLRGRSKEFNCQPLRLISTPYKLDNNKVYCSFSDISSLFYCYGTVIQRLLYDYDYYELNTYGGFEVDTVNLLPNLCLAHLLTDYRILQRCSDRGGSKPIDAELASRVLKAFTYFKSFKTWRDLYMAHLDLEAHTSLSDIGPLVQKIYSQYSPFSRDPDDYDYCAMDSIFVGPLDGIRYSELWSKQLANFCLSESLAQSSKSDISQVDVASLGHFNAGLLNTLFTGDHFETKEKLSTFIGKSFEPSKSGLGVL